MAARWRPRSCWHNTNSTCAQVLLPIRTGFEKAPSNRCMRPQWPALNRMEFLMSIKIRIAALALAGIAFAGSMAFTTTQAHARGFGLGWGIGAGLLGAAVVGSAIAANDGYYYDGYRRCGL